LESSKTIEEVITRAKQAGIDVSEREKALKESKEKLIRLRNAFFPA